MMEELKKEDLKIVRMKKLSVVVMIIRNKIFFEGWHEGNKSRNKRCKRGYSDGY